MNSKSAPIPSVPTQAARQRLHSSEESEFEIGKSTDVSFSKFDQDGQQAEADQGGEPGPWPARQQRYDILAGRQQECHQRNDQQRQQMPTALKIGRNGKTLEDIEGGIQRRGAEYHAGDEHEHDGQHPSKQRRQLPAVAAPKRASYERTAVQRPPQYECPA